MDLAATELLSKATIVGTGPRLHPTMDAHTLPTSDLASRLQYNNMTSIPTKIGIPISSVDARLRGTSPGTGTRRRALKDSVLDLLPWVHALSDALAIS